MTSRALLVATLAALACAACSNTAPSSSLPPDQVTTEALPSPWAGKTNPLPDDAATIAKGRGIFERSCTPCHGVNADGNGPAAAGLNPKPANFRDGVRLASHSDAYLFMRISSGKHDTAMPAFGGVLSEDDRWAILRYLRSLPGAKQKD